MIDLAISIGLLCGGVLLIAIAQLAKTVSRCSDEKHWIKMKSKTESKRNSWMS